MWHVTEEKEEEEEEEEEGSRFRGLNVRGGGKRPVTRAPMQARSYSTPRSQMSSPWAGKHSRYFASTPAPWYESEQKRRAGALKARNGQLRPHRRRTIVAVDRLMFRRFAAKKQPARTPG